MNQTQKDIFVFGILITVFSVIAINTAITVSFVNGVVMGVVEGIGILICVGVRRFMIKLDEEGITKAGECE